MDSQHNTSTSAKQAPDDHLPFTLREMRYSLDLSLPKEFSAVNYATLAAAISALLDPQKLQRCDPQVATAAGQPFLGQVAVVNRYTEAPYAQYVYARPGAEPDRAYEGPGIYLRVPLGSVWLQEMTGLPFPQDDDLDTPTMLLLAEYKKGYQELIPTPLFHTLSDAAAKYRLQQQTSFDSHGFILALHGHYIEPQHALKGQEVIRFCEFHHFTNGFEAIRQLLLTNINSFNHECAGGNLPYQYDQACVMSPEGQPVAIIHNRSLADHLFGDSRPGIWLEATGGVGALYDHAAIDFPRWTGVEDSRREVQLAVYKYDRALSLQHTKGVASLITQLRMQHKVFYNFPISPLTLQVQYDIAPVDGEDAPLISVRHYYHHNDCRAALQQMTSLDIPTMLDRGERIPIALLKAVLTTRNGTEFAKLAVTPYDEQPYRVDLQILTGVRTYDPGLFSALCGVLKEDPATQDNIIPLAFTIGEYDLANLRPLPTPQADVLAGLLTNKANTGAAAIDTQVPPGTNSAYIRLEWNRAARSGEILTEVISLSQDLHATHRFLLQMDEKLFVPEPGNPDRAWLVSASLQDRLSEEIIVKRFCQWPSELQPGGGVTRIFNDSYLQYHQGRSDARGLAESLGVGVAEAMAPAARSCLPREFPDDAGPATGKRPRH